MAPRVLLTCRLGDSLDAVVSLDLVVNLTECAELSLVLTTAFKAVSHIVLIASRNGINTLTCFPGRSTTRHHREFARWSIASRVIHILTMVLSTA